MVQAVEETERRDLPAALRLLDEMNDSVAQVTSCVDRMLLRVKSGEVTTANGLSFLEMKYHMLLGYLINLTYVVLRKCSGERIENDPAIDRLVEIRTVLEKIRPIDAKLKYQIDKLVRTATTGATDDASLYGPRPENLVQEEPEDEDENVPEEKPESGGVYVPPKLIAMHYDGDETKAEREKKTLERSRKRALESSVIRELREEYTDSPLEISSGNRNQKAMSKRQRDKIEYEEDYLTRLPVTKAEKHKQRKVSTVGNIGDEIVDFGEYGAALDDGSNVGSKKKKKRKMIARKKGKSSKRIRFH